MLALSIRLSRLYQVILLIVSTNGVPNLLELFCRFEDVGLVPVFVLAHA